mgnify:CR=1 FL=1
MSRTAVNITFDATAASAQASTFAELAEAYHAATVQRLGDTDSGRRQDLNQRCMVQRFTDVAGELHPSNIKPATLRRFALALHQQTDFTGVYCREHIKVVKRVIRWGVEQGMVDASVYHVIRDVKGLERGEGRPSTKRRPVAWETVAATLPHMPPTCAAAALVLWHTGLRPSEILTLKVGDLDTGNSPWMATLSAHKTSKHIGDRCVYFGPKASSIIECLIVGRAGDAFVFSARRDRLETRLHLAVQRQTAPTCGNRARTTRRDAADRPLCVGSLRQAIHRGCDAAGVDRWTTYQLRHAAATRLARDAGLAGAQAALGHTTGRMTEHYADRGEVAAAVAMQHG